MISAPTSVADEGCSATEFKCTNGQCVSAKMRCDGHPDCLDRSDEEGCVNAPACTTKHRCPQSKECLVQEWICDGDQDCKDGTDEKVDVEGHATSLLGKSRPCFKPLICIKHYAFRSRMNTTLTSSSLGWSPF